MKVLKLTQQSRKKILAFGSVFPKPHLYTKEAKAHVKIASIVKINPIISLIKIDLC